MPNAPLPKSDDGIGYQWLHIDDFTPGIYDFDVTNTEGSNDYIPAPLGSCIPSGTYGCIGLPNGGLAPLPWLSVTPALWPFSVTTPVWLVGIETNTARAFDPLTSAEVDTTELIIIAESDNGTTHVFAVNSYIVETATDNAILFSSSATTGKIWGSPYPQWTLLTSESAITFPVLVFPSIVPTDSQGINGHMYNYPSLAATTAYGTDDMIPLSDSGKTGQLICYDGRVLGLTSPDYNWPPGSGERFFSNEFIEYTDPPGENTYFPTGEELAILVPENPFGYGVAGSISAGELFLVKKRGGGVLVLGDIDAPSSVTYLPGVRPTGGFFGKGDSTVLGFVYCSQGAGAWAWNGSNVSTKFSSQLDDNFFDVAVQLGMPSNNYGFFIKKWGPAQIVLFSNSWVFYEATQSWWKLSGAAGAPIPFYHYTDARDQHQIYALPLQITTEAEPFLYTYDSRVQAPLYQWTSTQLFSHITKTSDRVVDIRDIIITASSHWSNAGTIEVQVISSGSVVWTGNLELTVGVDPLPYRLNAAAIGLDNFRIAITAANSIDAPGASEGAPTVWSVDIGYRTRAKVPSGN
jgi:hypothetical protein